jgi:hypothetical protein
MSAIRIFWSLSVLHGGIHWRALVRRLLRRCHEKDNKSGGAASLDNSNLAVTGLTGAQRGQVTNPSGLWPPICCLHEMHLTSATRTLDLPTPHLRNLEAVSDRRSFYDPARPVCASHRESRILVSPSDVVRRHMLSAFSCAETLP